MRVLWADAICINQKDTQERAEQVQLMGLIYWKAYCVRIWLGRDEELQEPHRAKYAIRVIKQLASVHIIALGETAEEYKAYCNIKFEEPNKITESEWLSLRALLTRPWFQRVWVVQEYGLARDAMFHCGELRFTRRELKEFFSLLNRSTQRLKRSQILPTRTILLGDDYWCSCRGGGRLELGSDPKEAETFLDLLRKTRGLSLTDKRDSIYAFLGHPSAFKRQLLDVEPYHWYPRNYYYGRTTLITPDYDDSNTYLQVCRQLAIAAIRDVGLGLNVLSHVAHYDDTIESEMPSWVPRWDVLVSTYFRGIDIYFAASGTLPSTTFDLLSLDQLSFKALRLDTIRCVRRAWVTEYLDKCLDLMALLLSDAPKLRRPNAVPIPKLLTYPYEEPFVAAFASTMTAGLTSSWNAYCEPSDTSTPQHVRNFHAYYRREHPQDFPPLTDKETEYAEYFAGDVDRASSDRLMFITHDGRLGLGPMAMDASDEIWIPIGAKMPVILRPYSDGRFRIVGQTYVDGVMRGEAFKGKKEEDFENVVLV